MLTQAGKAMHIQAVGQAIPLYSMNCFKLPKRLVSEINMMIMRFWWGDVGGKRKIDWKEWSKLCVSKKDGGLSFRDLEAFNPALLAKKWWRLVHDDNSLAHRVFKGMYFPNTTPMMAGKGQNPSFLWKKGPNGELVTALWFDVWKDLWIPGIDTPLRDSFGSPPPTPLKVKQLFKENSRCWNVDL